jgi:hypothetical protein
MLVKIKQDERGSGKRRRVRVGHRSERSSATIQPEGSLRERRHGGASQDRALYTCECGYAFVALVTTSVGCPHCARTQAW